MNTPARMFSAVSCCSRITNSNSCCSMVSNYNSSCSRVINSNSCCSRVTNSNYFYISRRFLKINPNNKTPKKTWKQLIIWQFWRPLTNPESGRFDFWNSQYNVLTWSLIIFITLNLIYPKEDYDGKSWVKRFLEIFQKEPEGENKLQGENIKTFEENRARVRRAIEARKIAKLSEENKTKSIAEQLAELDVEK